MLSMENTDCDLFQLVDTLHPGWRIIAGPNGELASHRCIRMSENVPFLGGGRRSGGGSIE